VNPAAGRFDWRSRSGRCERPRAHKGSPECSQGRASRRVCAQPSRRARRVGNKGVSLGSAWPPVARGTGSSVGLAGAISRRDWVVERRRAPGPIAAASHEVVASGPRPARVITRVPCAWDLGWATAMPGQARSTAFRRRRSRKLPTRVSFRPPQGGTGASAPRERRGSLLSTLGNRSLGKWVDWVFGPICPRESIARE